MKQDKPLIEPTPDFKLRQNRSSFFCLIENALITFLSNYRLVKFDADDIERVFLVVWVDAAEGGDESLL